jgi:hypothetical protein
MLPIHACNFIEHRSQQFVSSDALVEAVHELFDILFSGDILQQPQPTLAKGKIQPLGTASEFDQNGAQTFPVRNGCRLKNEHTHISIDIYPQKYECAHK